MATPEQMQTLMDRLSQLEEKTKTLEKENEENRTVIARMKKKSGKEKDILLLGKSFTEAW